MGRAKKSRRGGRDRISSLPDFLLHVIMSFLTAQQAVRTCILSKRWQNLWTTLPFLDFDFSKFECHDESHERAWEDGDTENYKFHKFKEFVNLMLLLREASNLHNFRLSCKSLFDLDKYDLSIRSWILYALKHNPQVLYIDFMLDDSVPLGMSIFTCASLVEVSLCFSLSLYRMEVPLWKVINLPCLRRLHLGWIYLEQAFVDKLFCGCPILEFLHLEHCFGEYSTINSPSLKHLKIENEIVDCVLELINTPNILSFCYKTYIHNFEPKMLLKMPSLTNAKICMDCALYRSENCFKEGKSNILIGLSDVQNLELSGNGLMGFLENELPNCPEFSNLKNLWVEHQCLSCHFNLLGSFLNHCPNLEKLSIQYPGSICTLPVHRNRKSLKIAPFKRERLTTVEFKFSKHDDNFPLLVKYLQDITRNSRAQINMTSID